MADAPIPVQAPTVPAGEQRSKSFNQIIDLDSGNTSDVSEDVNDEDQTNIEPAETEEDDETSTVVSSDDEPEDGEEEGELEETPAAKEKSKNKSGVTKLKEQNAALKAELETLRRSVPKETDEQRLAKAVEQELGAAPVESDYTDYLEYQNAKISYDTAKRIETARIKRELKSQDGARNESVNEVIETFKERANDLKKQVKDFDKVVAASNWTPKHEEVTLLIINSEKGALLAYYLAKYPKVAEKLDAMTPINAAREIGRLEKSVSLAKPNTTSKAPPPIEKLPSGKTTSTRQKDPDRMSMEEFAEARKSGKLK